MNKTVAVNERGYRVGEDHPNARYTNAEIELVLEMRDEGFGYKRIAKMLEMPRATVRDICQGKRRCQTPVAWRGCVVAGE